MAKGVFIVFEGGEKVGKTTQIGYLKTFLEARGFSVLTTKEPGGGDPAIREKLLALGTTLTGEQELELFCKDRQLHVENHIAPALMKGIMVLCDRFEPSGIAYQGYGRGLDITRVREKSRAARGDIYPDLTLLLDADPQKVLARTEATSRFDAERIGFHQRVREGFLAQAATDPEHWRIIDATKSIEKVSENIQQYVAELLQKRS